MKEHVNIISSINDLLEQMRRLGALQWKHEKPNFEDIEKNRHHYYDEDHPTKLILPFLNLVKLRTYLSGFPGLHEINIGK